MSLQVVRSVCTVGSISGLLLCVHGGFYCHVGVRILFSSLDIYRKFLLLKYYKGLKARMYSNVFKRIYLYLIRMREKCRVGQMKNFELWKCFPRFHISNVFFIWFFFFNRNPFGKDERTLKKEKLKKKNTKNYCDKGTSFVGTETSTCSSNT